MPKKAPSKVKSKFPKGVGSGEYRQGKKASVSAVAAKALAASALSKGERWVVSTDGKTRTYTTSPKSARVIKEAAKKYSNALKRLADR